MKTLIIVSGGDAPGINPAIVHFTLLASAAGDIVVGAEGSYAGVFRSQIMPITTQSVRPFMGQTGTLLASTREVVLNRPDARETMLGVLQAHEIDNVLLFGGDGTLTHTLPLLMDWGIPTVALPTTIDNDVPGTERTLGFDSACNFAYPSIDGIRSTARAMPGRIFIVETLGGRSGCIALAVAHGAGAHAVLVPEYDYDIEKIGQRIRRALDAEQYALLVVSEGVPELDGLGVELERVTGVRTRHTRLGHGQRGAAVTHIDRVLAIELARLAYGHLRAGDSGVLLMRDGELALHRGTIAGFPRQLPDAVIYRRINGLG